MSRVGPWAQSVFEVHRAKSFLIRSMGAENIEIAKRENVWATTFKNENVLREAFTEGPVLLFFLVTGVCHQWEGVALMRSLPGKAHLEKTVFHMPNGRPFTGRMFSIEWIVKARIPFSQAQPPANTLNHGRPAQIGRDGQPLADSCAKALAISLCLNDPQHVLPVVGRQSAPAPAPVANFLSDSLKDKLADLASVLKRVQADQASKTTTLMPPDNSGPAPLKPFRFVRPQLETQAAVAVPVKFLYTGISPWQVNPALQIYPLDLSILTYEEYCEIWQVSAKAREAREARGLPLDGPFPWPSTVFWQLLKAGHSTCKRQKTS